MSSAPPGSMLACLKRLAAKDVRFGTVIDIGCADGSFFLMAKLEGILKRATVLHIDANELYEPSLQAIQKVVGGHYFIGAVCDRVGEVDIAASAHPYWASMRPEGDLYWDRVGGVRGSTRRVAASTLDALVAKHDLKPPFLLKLDVQGAELVVLAGASAALAQTDVVVCEADIADFAAIHQALTSAGFSLYDLTGLERLRDGSLGWFHPVYVSSRIAQVLPKAFWGAQDNAAIIKAQSDRRAAILQFNADALKKLAQQK